MVPLTLTAPEAATLARVLDVYISDLRFEIADTESMDFREGLKQEEALLKRLVEQLRAGAAT